jgi:hypothetical protein
MASGQKALFVPPVLPVAPVTCDHGADKMHMSKTYRDAFRNICNNTHSETHSKKNNMRGFTQEALVCRAHKRSAGLRFDLDVWIDAKRASSCTIDRQNECIGLSAASSWIVHAAKHMLYTYAFAKQWQGNLTT